MTIYISLARYLENKLCRWISSIKTKLLFISDKNWNKFLKKTWKKCKVVDKSICILYISEYLPEALLP